MRLSFDFYRTLAENLDEYETHFSQLLRDYDREIKGERLFFAIDFSELYNYIHPTKKEADRAEINTYILNTLDDQFTILPGAVGELLTDLETVVPKHLEADFGQAIIQHRAVAQFRYGFSENIENEERLLQLYVNAENELRSALGEIFDVVFRGQEYTSIQSLHNLLGQGKLAPIQGVRQIGPLSPDAKKLSDLVEAHLMVSRPDQETSNQIDALDFITALLLNQQGGPPSNRYIAIYSQATSLIRACRSHRSLQWDNDYLIRESKYLQFRTKLQEEFPDIEQRYKQVTEFRNLCQILKSEMSELVDIAGRLKQEPITPSLRLIEMLRKFDEECIQLFTFKAEREKESITRERIQQLYYTLGNEKKFVGKSEEAFEVLKEHLRTLHDTLQAFIPEKLDTEDVRSYKANLRKWLGL